MNRSLKYFSLFILLPGLLLLIYFPSLRAPFQYDDFFNIVQNKSLNREHLFPFLWANKTRAFSYLTFAWNQNFYPESPFGYHLFNLILHGLNSHLVFLLFYSLLSPQSRLAKVISSRRFFTAFATATLFACHPLQSQAVCYISQRFESLSALFSLGSCILFLMIRQIQSQNTLDLKRLRGIPLLKLPLLFILFILSTLLAFLSKETSLSIFPLLILLEWAGNFKRNRRDLGLVFFSMALLISASLIHFWEPLTNLGFRLQSSMPRLDYLFVQSRVLILYLKLWFIPFGQTLDHQALSVLPWTHFLLLYSLIAWSLITAVSLYFCRRFPPFLFTLIWYLSCLAPTSSFFPIRDMIMEHRTYLANAGLAFILSVFLANIAVRNLRLFCFSLFVLLLSLLTWNRSNIWADPVLLWQEAIHHNPNNARPHNNLGLYLLERGEWELAQQSFQRAIQAEPDLGHSYYNLALSYHQLGHLKEARTYYKESVTRMPGLGDGWRKLAEMALFERDAQSAVQYYRNLFALQEGALASAKDLRNMAWALLMNRKNDDAILFANTARFHAPKEIESYLTLAAILGGSGRHYAALKHYQTALDIDPDNQVAMNGFKTAQMHLKKVKQPASEII